MLNSRRFERQIRLPEVGELGQARIAETSFEVLGNSGALVEVLYLHRAGAERLHWIPRGQARPFRHAPVFRFLETREFAAGAWRALEQILRAVRVSEC